MSGERIVRDNYRYLMWLERYPLPGEVSDRIRFDRAGARCECEGECGTGHGHRCEAEHGVEHPITGSPVVLTTAHRDCRDDNLAAMCQLAYDRRHHADTRLAHPHRGTTMTGCGCPTCVPGHLCRSCWSERLRIISERVEYITGKRPWSQPREGNQGGTTMTEQQPNQPPPGKVPNPIADPRMPWVTPEVAAQLKPLQSAFTLARRLCQALCTEHPDKIALVMDEAVDSGQIVEVLSACAGDFVLVTIDACSDDREKAQAWFELRVQQQLDKNEQG
jgi:hypothetical protein